MQQGRLCTNMAQLLAHRAMAFKNGLYLKLQDKRTEGSVCTAGWNTSPGLTQSTSIHLTQNCISEE